MTANLTRRGLLLGLSATAAAANIRVAFARVPGERRFAVVILRGALDGLYAVQPYGDPGLAALRRPLLLPQPGEEAGLLDLGGFFGLHPAMPELHAMYARGEAALLHAVAGPYRTRSHFEGQDLLEAGTSDRLSSGWLNRAIAALPSSGSARAGLAVGGGVPLLLRGSTTVGVYSPPGLEAPPPDLFHRIAELQAGDPRTAATFEEGMRSRGFASTVLGPDAAEQRDRSSFPRLAAAAGRLLAEAEGPRVAAMELGGWDTHVGQAARLTPLLGALDAGLAALRTALGADWANTSVLVVTEFGRTARVNGNLGTDHGTAGVAIVLGGAVAGGRVIATWPGLAPDKLFENRDLAPTTDLRAVAKGLLRDGLGLPDAAIAAAFPGSAGVAPMGGLLRARV